MPDMMTHLPDVILIRRLLLKWYVQVRRDLPWRAPMGSKPGCRPDAWGVLISEIMLQQTQVATVIPYYQKFINRFPTPAALAQADEHQVLRLWQGLGYYSRARNLQRAARAIVRDHGGQVPGDPAALLALPGIGRYTAGAVSSLAFGLPEPIVDGNVARVICRLEAITEDPRLPAIQKLLWQRAAEWVPNEYPGDFNSAMMELGAMVCTPRQPACLLCPLRPQCRAQARGLQDAIPLKRIAAPTPRVCRWTLCVHMGDRWLLEQRPATGRWAGLWQFVTIESPDAKPRQSLTAAEVKKRWGLSIKSSAMHHAFIEHALTHRRYRFEVFVAEAKEDTDIESILSLADPASAAGKGAKSGRSTKSGNLAGLPVVPSAGPVRRWLSLDELNEYPLSRPHLKIVDLLRQMSQSQAPSRKSRRK